jgi:5-methyltetrahydropteroyltriglutamate--homocysteine methyltransferase
MLTHGGSVRCGPCNNGPNMLRTAPPFRADHVGSLLRPAQLKEARARHERLEIGAAELKSIEDRWIQEVIAKQEAAGLRGVTDGEFRREFWHLDFLAGLDGVEWHALERGIQFKGGETKPKGLRVTGKIGCAHHPMLEHFQFLKDHTKATAKMTIPSPSVLHYRGGRNAVTGQVYPVIDEFYHDLGQAYKKAVAALGAAGCKYLQLDEVNFTYLCDTDQRQMLRDRGDNPDKLPDIYADMINAAISGRPEGMRMTMHLCRGNYKSMWIAQGGYEPVAEVLFHKINIDAYFMEWDSDRAGSFEPLRLVPKNKQVVLGLVTTKSGKLETKDELKRRIDEASKFIDLDQLCLSGQCGFASTEEGNLLAEEEQWAKLRLVVETANEVWG